MALRGHEASGFYVNIKDLDSRWKNDMYLNKEKEDGWSSEGMRLRVPPVESQLPLGQNPG